MNINDAKQNFVFVKTVQIGDADYIKLREPTTLEMKNFSEDSSKNVDMIIKLLPSVIVEHSFTNEDGSQASAKDVTEFIVSSGSLFTSVVDEWMAALPLAQKSKEKSVK